MTIISHPDHKLCREYRFTSADPSAVNSIPSTCFSKCLNKNLWGVELENKAVLGNEKILPHPKWK